MSSSRVRFSSLHISAHRGEERRGEKEAEGVKKAKKCEGDEEERKRGREEGEGGYRGTQVETQICLLYTSEYGVDIWFKLCRGNIL